VRRSHLISLYIVLLIFISALGYSPAFAKDQVETWNENFIEGQSRSSNKQKSPIEIISLNLPLMDQYAQTTPGPVDGEGNNEEAVEADLSTPTPTPIPVQRGSVNLPIVIGALAIILVIMLAWFFKSFLPKINRG
jgi:hypothetical protein